ncbi:MULTISPECIES: MBL fold metallo-hydrolase [Haloferacaceae]|uniref:MBL fold metallo-hydrolase n=1 Tax=Halorubrum glutamatedens TaxID=2707018 RepID=A0ABD5QRC1_9EURY|nr:MBL fold metallo-hydrolase [Halobellus captivus]
MVTSTWTDWFVRDEVEATDPDGLSIWYLGCNGFVLRTDEATVYVDPYFGTGGHRRYAVRMCPVPMDPVDATRCDAVLVTHGHVDHLHPPSYRPLLDLGADLYAPSGALEDPSYGNDLRIPSGQCQPVSVGMEFEIGDLRVSVRGADDPDAVDPVSYVIEYGDNVFFHGGDSGPCEEFSAVGTEFDVDLGALAFGSAGLVYDGETATSERTRWYMDENEIVEAANQLRLDRLLPTHWNMWKGAEADPSPLHDHASSFRYPHVVEVGRTGDRFELERPGVRPPVFAE